MRFVVFAANETGYPSPVGKEFQDGRFGAWAFDTREAAEGFAKGIDHCFVAGHDEEAMVSLVHRLQRHNEGSGLLFVDEGKTTGWYRLNDFAPPTDGGQG